MEEVTYHEIAGLRIVAHWQPGKLGPVQLTINALDPNDNLGINPRKMKEVFLESLRPLPRKEEGNLYDCCDWLAANKTNRRGGNQTYPPEFWARLALAYTLAMAEGIKDPGCFLGDMTDTRRDTVAGWIAKARSYGYLTSITKGHNGGMAHGELTDKSREILYGDRPPVDG